MSRRCRRIRAMKVLVESIETGVRSDWWVSSKNGCAGLVLRSCGGVNRDAGTLARITRSIPRQPSVSVSTPKPSLGLFPAKSRHPSRSSALSPHPSRHRAGAVLDAVYRPKGRVKLGPQRQSRPGPSPTAPVQLPSPLTRSHTRYRTRPFDNLRLSCKFRAYWGFEKSRNNEDVEGHGV